MKTIRSKLISAYMVPAAIGLAVILVLFNVVMRFYFVKTSRDELKSTYSTMNVLVEKQLMNYVVGQSGTAALSGLSAALTAARLSGSTEFYILDDAYQIIFPADAKSAFEGALGKAVQKYDFSNNPGGIKRIITKNGPLFIAGKTFDIPVGELRVVFVTGMTGGNRVTGAINLILAAIMLVTLAAEFLFSAKSARDLSRPIQKTAAAVKEIGNGNFVTAPEDHTSVETRALTVGINEMSARLKAADEAQKLFLQNASHELRTPLMSIQGYSEAIEKGIVSDPVQAAAIIKTESIRLTALVEELITLSKIDNNLYDKAFLKIDLGEALSECVFRLNGLALKEQKEIILTAIPGVAAFADENLFAKAIDNVLSNCLRYAKKTVAIGLSCQDGTATIRISDDGEGIAPADLPHIFDRFYKGKGGKFGLGLAIAKKALELMGGSITAQNETNGAVFAMHLPAELQKEE